MKRVLYIFIFFIIAVVGYYSFEIAYAFKVTPGVKAEFLDPANIDLDFEELSNRQKEILIKVQDPNFWNHSGVEFSTPGSGWTTITQSLAKWFYFNPFKPGIRKIKQTLLARFVITYQFSKKEQLTVFINHVWFAKNVRGFRKAAHHFYQKEIDDLTEDEFISLVAMPVSPNKYNIITNRKNNQLRSKRIKNLIDGLYTPKGLFDIYYDKS